MSYRKRLDRAFENAPVLPITNQTKYVFFSDCHRGAGTNNDNFLKNSNSYAAALQYYYQYGFCYVEVGDGDELWENKQLSQILEIHEDVFCKLRDFQRQNRLYMLYGNHDMVKKKTEPLWESFACYEGLLLQSIHPAIDLRITHGHQADLLNSVFWRLARFLVRYLWTPLESLGFLDPTSAAKNNRKGGRLTQKYITYATERDCLLMTGHTHKPALCTRHSPYCNCGSCVHPRCITCIELCGYEISLVKWHICAEKSGHFGNIYAKCPPAFPVYVKREVLQAESLIS
ncbi:MAG: serine/threonine protein phosphatase [Lachnospiraceae bacterium]|nr:serine/threonine protein phosphatase [Lachnospiraceae bacterium]